MGIGSETAQHRGARPTRRGKAGLRRRSSKDVWQSGDAVFDLPEMRQKRAALREHPDVVAALDAWWDTTDADGNGVIDAEEVSDAIQTEDAHALVMELVEGGSLADYLVDPASQWQIDMTLFGVFSCVHGE